MEKEDSRRKEATGQLIRAISNTHPNRNGEKDKGGSELEGRGLGRLRP
ncbi:hypothetical protein COLO4_04391 [Corchorus olitorius]|uniref:Uncharacterized protein n=1 Tax=Corchorus olitorius TaxID=93759 RepID=A0A1R3KU70_9ROSI|nr:hypothetical protein COLO4_04391 [Corchorus olitorius]